MFLVKRHNGELERQRTLKQRKVRSYPSTCPSRYASGMMLECRRCKRVYGFVLVALMCSLQGEDEVSPTASGSQDVGKYAVMVVGDQI